MSAAGGVAVQAALTYQQLSLNAVKQSANADAAIANMLQQLTVPVSSSHGSNVNISV